MNAAGKCDVIVVRCSFPTLHSWISLVSCKISQWQQESEMMMRSVCLCIQVCKNVSLYCVCIEVSVIYNCICVFVYV